MWIQHGQLQRSCRPNPVNGVSITRFNQILRHQKQFVVAVQANGAASILNIVPYAIRSGIKFAKIKPVTNVGGSSDDRGLIATQSIDSQECLCSVPVTAALRVTPGCPAVLEIPQSLWQELPWYVQLALLVLAEAGKGSGSPYAEYIKTLPGYIDVPALWRDEELQQLKCQYFIEQVQQQQQEWHKTHQQLQQYLVAAGIHDTRQQLFWALSIVRSRAFAAPFMAAPLSTAPKLFLAAQLVVLLAGLASGPTAAAVAEVAGAATAAVTAFTLLQQSKSSQQQHALCPLLDLFNHDSNVQSECELDAWAGEFRVVSSQPWQAGEQVFINYSSSSSNDALLQLYGFIDPGNTQDRFVVKTLPTSLKLAGLNQQQNAPQVLSQVSFTQHGVPHAAAVALEQLCSDNQPSICWTVAYHQLSDQARAVCARAIMAELQELGVHPAEDQELLIAFQQLPCKRKDLIELQQHIKRLTDVCSQLAAETEEQQQQQQQQQDEQQQDEQQQDEQQPVAQGSHHSSTQEDATASKMLHILLEQQQLLADAREKQQLLMDVVQKWTCNTADVKRAAIAYRLEKYQLLNSILQKLH